MILRFRVENFRSLRTKQEISFVASGLDKSDSSVFRVDGLDEAILPIAAIYGANASGKTNVLRALHFFCRAVQDSHNKWKPNSSIDRQPFGRNESSSMSSFELDFVLEGIAYTYGFCVTSSEVSDEWLFSYPSKKKQTLFRRKRANFTFGKHFVGNKRLIETTVRANSLFLSAAAQNNHVLLSKIYKWIDDWIIITDERNSIVKLAAEICKDVEARDLLLSFVRNADLGIVGMQTKNHEPTAEVLERLERVTKNMPEEMAQQIRMRTLEKIEFNFIHSGPNNSNFTIDSADESQGTLNYFGLIAPVLLAINNGGVLIVDELDESLHPALIKGVLGLFTSPKSNVGNAQLIFNTHDTNLLDLDLLRRDEIWFSEKDTEGATHVYPLTDFRPRSSEKIDRGYLEGRYGAIPFLGEFTRLIENEA